MAKYNSRINTGYGLTEALPSIFPRPIIAQRAPTAEDIGYTIAQVWVDQPNDDVYALTSVGAGVATWIISATGTLFETLTPDTGTSPVVADATNTISVLGGTNIGSVGGASTLTMNLDAAIELDSVECGTNLARISAYTTNLAIIQAFADEDTATGAAVREAIYGNLQVTAGDGNHTPSAIWGSIDVASGSNALQTLGVYGLCTQEDGAVIASTAAGIDGHIVIKETDVADLPQVYAFGVKGYYGVDDAAAVPATGEFAAVGAVMEYTTPMDTYGYGIVSTRLGGGAGTAARAAFGVAQGSQAIPDWLFGVDLFNTTPGNAGQPYTNADIRFQNQSTLVVATEGVTFSGDVSSRNLNATNTNITFNSAPVMATKADTGGVPTTATGAENLMVLQEGEIMEQHVLGSGQTIIAPVMTAGGLLVSLDLADDEGCEMGWGFLASNKHAYTVGTSPAFFFEMKITIADAGGADPVYIGFRKQEAYQAAFTSYTDFYLIGVEETQTTEVITIADQLNTGGVTYSNTTDVWTDGQTKTLRVSVSAAGVVTATIDGVAPSTPRAFTFDDGDVIQPIFYGLHGAATPGAWTLVSMAAGYQAWV